MAIVSGYTITPEQYKEFEARQRDNFTEDEFCYRISCWADGSVTLDDGDSILVEFVPDQYPEASPD